MAPVFSSVYVFHPNSSGGLCKKYDGPILVQVDYDPQGLSVKFKKDHHILLQEFLIHQYSECSRIVPASYLITIDWESYFLKFKDQEDMVKFHTLINEVRRGKTPSVFSQRTEDSSAIQYFQFYGYLSQQQNMLQDYVRTSTYQRAILINSEDFKDKVILDVGAGSGILSFFAVQAGASKVYAVEASSMALHAESLVAANNLQGRINVIAGKIEEIDLPESVDIIISEPMGYMLYNERMLETYLHAKKWLKPSGKMFPSQGDLHIVPFMDDALYMEQTNKANFWVQSCFHGVDLSYLRGAAMKEYFRQPIVDTFDMRICLAKSVRHSLDFTEASETDLHKIAIPLEFTLLESGTVHGLAFWFDVAFIGSVQTVWLSTAPTESLTHWYQVRCLLETPILAKAGQIMTGIVILEANQRQSYDVTIELGLEGVTTSRSSNTLDLKNPYFRYTGQPVVPPPGSSTTSPSEAYWQQIDSQNRQAINIVTESTLKDIVQDTPENLANNQCVVTQTNMHINSINGTDKLRMPLCLTSSGTLIASPMLGAQQNSNLTMAMVDGSGQINVNNDANNPIMNEFVITGSNPLDAHNYRS